MIEGFQLPSPTPDTSSFQAWLRWLGNYGNNLYSYLNKWEQALSNQFNTLFNGYGNDITAATTMTVSSAVHKVLGSTTVTTLSQPPGQTACSVVTLFANDGFTLGAGDNIQTPMSVAKGGSVILAYHPALKKWLTVPGNPSVVALTSSNSPYAVMPGADLYITATGAPFIANLPVSPSLGDSVFVKTLSGSTSAVALTPPAGVAIDNQAVGAALNVTVNNTALLSWIGTSWQSKFKSS